MKRPAASAPSGVVLAAALVVLLASCGGSECQDLNPTMPGCQDTAPVVLLVLDQTSLTLLPQDTVAVKATVTENGQATSATVQWSSANSSVATVTSDGKVVGVSAGTAQILATANASGNALSGRVDVVVRTGAKGTNTVVTDSVLKLLSDSTEIASGVLKLQKLVGTASVKVGDVVVGSEGGGYLKKVRSVSEQGNQITLQTEQASIEQALEDAVFELQNALSLGSAPRGVSPVTGQPFLSPASIEAMPGVSVSPSGVVSLNGVQFGFTAQHGGGSVTVETKIVNGSFNFSPGFDAGAKVKLFQLKKFHAKATGAMTFDANVETKISGTVRSRTQQDLLPRKVQRLLTARFPTTCFPVAGVPVCYQVVFGLNAYVETSATLSGTIHSSYAANGSLQLGAQYERGSGWTPIASRSGGSQIGPMQVSAGGEVGVRFGVAPEISLIFYQVAGPFIGIDGSVGLAAGIDAFDWYAKADAKLDLVLGFKIEILSFELASFSTNLRLWGVEQDLIRQPAYTVTVTPATATMPVGGQQQLSLRAFLLGGIEVPLPGTPTWTSNAPGIATVTSAGLVRGVAEGGANVTASFPPSTLTATSAVTVTRAGPAFEIATSNLSFNHTVGQTSCPQDIGTFTVTNNSTTTGTLQVGTGASRLDFLLPDNSSGRGSLTANVARGVTTVRVRFNCTQATSFNETVTVQASNAQGSASKTFTVTATIVTPTQPSIALNPTSLAFTAAQGGANPPLRTVTVTNNGGGTLTGLTTSISYGAGQPTGWLTAPVSPSSAPATLNVSAKTGSLPAGTYTATIAVSGQASNSPQNVAVTFTVVTQQQPPAIGLGPTSLSFSAQQGGASPANQSVAVSNTGGGTLSGLARAISYGSGQPTGWLAAALGSTTAPTTLTVTATTGSLSAGTYNATIAVTSGQASNSPQNVSVTFTVSSGGDQTPPTVTAWTPAAAGAGIETVVTAQFSESINPNTLPGNLTLTGPGGAVAGSVTYNAGTRTATFTPSAPLTEFQTQYTANATAGIRDLAGNALVAANRAFTTVVVDPAYSYRLRNTQLGDAKSLDTYSDTYRCFMGDTGGYSGQYWFFTPVDATYYHMRNQYGGDARYLEGAAPPDPCFLTGGGQFTGQHWQLVALGGGLYRLQTRSWGTARSLDTPLINGTPVPRMEPNSSGTGQQWRLLRLGHR